MSRLDRLDRLESRFPGPRELNVGGGRKILTTWEDRYDMVLSAMSDGDHPMLDTVRSGAGGPNPDPFVRLLRAFECDYETREEYEAALGIEAGDEEDSRLEISPEIKADLPKPPLTREERAAEMGEVVGGAGKVD